MTLKMYKITDFPTFFEKVRAQKLNFKTSYCLTLLAQEVEKHITFYQENFRNILVEYGQKDENGNLVPTADGQGVMLVQDKIEEAYAKISELRELDVELPDYKFSVDDFGTIELSPQEMLIILPFIEE